MKRVLSGIAMAVLVGNSIAQERDYSGVYVNTGNSLDFLVITQKGNVALLLRPTLTKAVGTNSVVGVGVGTVSGNTISTDAISEASGLCTYNVRYTVSSDGTSISGAYFSAAPTPLGATINQTCSIPSQIPLRVKIW